MKELKFPQLSVPEKQVTVDANVIIERMLEDIKTCDADTLTGIISYMYPVLAKYDPDMDDIVLTAVEDTQLLNDIF